MDKARAGIQSVEMGWKGAVPIKPLLALSVAVLFAHVIVLQSAPANLNFNAPLITRPFITRTIELAPPTQQPVTAPATSVKKKSSPPPPVAPVVMPAPEATAPAALAEPAPTATDTIADTPPAPPAASEQLAANPPVPPARPPRDDLPRATAYTLPGSTRLKYNVTGEVKGFPYSVRAELLWLHDGNSYDARLEVSAFLLGSRTQTSAGRITADGLAPTRFSDKARSELAAHFERDKGKVTFSANTPDAPLLAGAQDRLSVFVQLGAMIAGAPDKYPSATTIAVQTIGARDADTWLFTVGEQEKLKLPGGEQATLKLARNPQPGYDQKVELWLAPALAYLPVRIRLSQTNGDFVDLKWRATEEP